MTQAQFGRDPAIVSDSIRGLDRVRALVKTRLGLLKPEPLRRTGNSDCCEGAGRPIQGKVQRGTRNQLANLFNFETTDFGCGERSGKLLGAIGAEGKRRWEEYA